MDGFPERYQLFSFPRLRRIARFLGAPVVRDSHSEHFKPVEDPYWDCPNEVEAVLEAQVGREVAFGHITAEEALRVLSSEHPAEELNGYAEMSDQLRYGVEDGQQT